MARHVVVVWLGLGVLACSSGGSSGSNGAGGSVTGGGGGGGGGGGATCGDTSTWQDQCKPDNDVGDSVVAHIFARCASGACSSLPDHVTLTFCNGALKSLDGSPCDTSAANVRCTGTNGVCWHNSYCPDAVSLELEQDATGSGYTWRLLVPAGTAASADRWTIGPSAVTASAACFNSGSGGGGGSGGGDPCGQCLSSCQNLPGCCTGCNCLCESECGQCF